MIREYPAKRFMSAMSVHTGMRVADTHLAHDAGQTFLDPSLHDLHRLELSPPYAWIQPDPIIFFGLGIAPCLAPGFSALSLARARAQARGRRFGIDRIAFPPKFDFFAHKMREEA